MRQNKLKDQGIVMSNTQTTVRWEQNIYCPSELLASHSLLFFPQHKCTKKASKSQQESGNQLENIIISLENKSLLAS